MTAEGDKFEISAGRAGIHGAAKRGVAAMDHFFYIFNDRVTGMLDIEHFFKMVCKNFLYDIHKTILREKDTKSNP